MQLYVWFDPVTSCGATLLISVWVSLSEKMAVAVAPVWCRIPGTVPGTLQTLLGCYLTFSLYIPCARSDLRWCRGTETGRPFRTRRKSPLFEAPGGDAGWVLLYLRWAPGSEPPVGGVLSLHLTHGFPTEDTAMWRLLCHFPLSEKIVCLWSTASPPPHPDPTSSSNRLPTCLPHRFLLVLPLELLCIRESHLKWISKPICRVYLSFRRA